jgi:acyl transferase domain-containing protein
MNNNADQPDHSGEIAVIGMACRLPGAKDVNAFWSNIREGVESISFFSDEELIAQGIDASLVRAQNYVKAAAILEGVDQFDASFFGLTPREAEIMDPQQRIFLECAWEALENAGYDVDRYQERTGIYAGVGMNAYFASRLAMMDYDAATDVFQIAIANEKDHLTTRTSYKLNLRGPSISISTACSTSLVAIHLACQGLLNGECDMALAGGVSVRIPQKVGYLHQSEGIASPDGHCRAFDADAQGTVPGSGAGIVVLARLEDALRNGNCIYAVIKGSAVNNDGAQRVGYPAPNVHGQAEVIMDALAVAGVEPEEITYVETHGTGTPIGDPIEIAALTKAFSTATQKKGFCAIGSTKTNIGHLDTAAGVSSFIKTVLALKHRLLPPSLHFAQPNPAIDFANSHFYVNTKLTPWEAGDTPRRAGVSAFGLGGTNAHVILEEAPTVEVVEQGRPWKLLLLSAQTETALSSATRNLAEYLRQKPAHSLADIAYTLQVGRKVFSHRQAMITRDLDDAVNLLETLDPTRVLRSEHQTTRRSMIFLFPGLGDHYLHMAWGLYQAESVFREQVDYCAETLKPYLGLDLRSVLYSGKWRAPGDYDDADQQSDSGAQTIDLLKMLHLEDEPQDDAARLLNETWLAQPVVFTIEYALARLWMEWVGPPQAMIGYSLGEYVAACVSGAITLEDALFMVAKRARMIQELPTGAMLAVPLPEEEVRTLLGEHLSLAAVNASALCVVSGPEDAIAELEVKLAAHEIDYRRLQTSHAFHSKMMRPIVESYVDLVATIKINPPKIPYLSNVTGTWITSAQLADPYYWARHMCQEVRFADGVRELLKNSEHVFLEVGPGQTLSTLIMQNVEAGTSVKPLTLPSLRYAYERQPDMAFLLNALARLWLVGVQADWPRFYAQEQRQRIPLPTYPFERQRYWIEAQAQRTVTRRQKQAKRPNMADWFYLPSWKRSLLPPTRSQDLSGLKQNWLVFADEHIGPQLARRLEYEDQDVVTIMIGDRFSRNTDKSYTLRPQEPDDYNSLFADLHTSKKLPDVILHCWGISGPEAEIEMKPEEVREAQYPGFYSLIFLAQAFGKHSVTHPLQMRIIANHMHELEHGDVLAPHKATMLGPCKIIPQEYTNVVCQSIDIPSPEAGSQEEQKLLAQIVAELRAELRDHVVAYRGYHRWVQSFEPLPLESSPEQPGRLRERGTYLITGGLGEIGFTLGKWLATHMQARLVLTSHTQLPAEEDWAYWLATHKEDDSISVRIKRMQELQSVNAEMLIIVADVANGEQMQAVLEQTFERFGKLHGVIHAAGIIEEKYFLPIQELDVATCEAHFRPKIYGTMVLEELLRKHEIDFCLVLSSLSAVLGGLHFAAYASANMFQDACVFRHNQVHQTPWVSVNWDGVTPPETIDGIKRILNTEMLQQVVVSTGDLYAKLDQWIALTPLREKDDALADVSSTHHSRPFLQNAYIAPETEIEQAVAATWQNIIGIEPVGIYDNFFALGGHSLLATQIVTRLRKTFEIELPLRTFLEQPTVAELAVVITQLRTEQMAGNKGGTIPLVAVSREQALPLSFAQQRLWFQDQLQPGDTAYNIPISVEMRGITDIEALEHSLGEIVRRHETLRTTFSVKNGHPVQIIGAARKVQLSLIDLSAFAPQEYTAEIQRLEQQEALRPFDLQHGPLLRTTLLRLEQNVYALLLTFHHIVTDDRSINVFFYELMNIYGRKTARSTRSLALPELPVQYADFAIWQRQRLQGELLQTQLAYWKERLAGAPVLELVTDHQRPAMQSFKGTGYRFTLSRDVTSALKAMSQREGVTLFMTLLAAFKLLLYYYTGQDDIVVGSPIANRTHAEIEGLIGFFVNTLVLRTSLSGDPTFLELLERVRETALGAYAHQDIPFEEVVQNLNLKRDLSRNPLYQVMFSLHDILIPESEIPGVSLKQLAGSIEVVRLDLTLHMGEVEQELIGAIVYKTDLFDASTIQSFVEHLKELLHAVVVQNNTQLSALTGTLVAMDKEHALIEEEAYKKVIQQKLKNVRRKGIRKAAIIGEDA